MTNWEAMEEALRAEVARLREENARLQRLLELAEQTTRCFAKALLPADEELRFLRWWYMMAHPRQNMSRDELRALWTKNTGKEVPEGYRAEDEVW